MGDEGVGWARDVVVVGLAGRGGADLGPLTHQREKERLATLI